MNALATQLFSGLFGTLLSAGFAIAAIAAPAKPNVPEKLQVKSTESLLFKAYAKGAQVYTCKLNDKTKKYEWTFKAPVADLVDDRGNKIISHYAGPSWESLADKSKIKAKPIAKVDSSDTNAIPWLLLEVTDRKGTGMMTDVTSIHRINTIGGKAPKTVCGAANEGKDIGVGYEADYYFYGSIYVQGLW
jgi:hypothetical protein